MMNGSSLNQKLTHCFCLSRKMKIKRQGWKQSSKFGVWFGQAFSVWFDYLSKFSLIVTK